MAFEKIVETSEAAVVTDNICQTAHSIKCTISAFLQHWLSRRLSPETREGSVQHQGHVCSQTSAGGFHHAVPPFSPPFRRAVPEHSVCILLWHAEQTDAGWCPMQRPEVPTCMEHQGTGGTRDVPGHQTLNRGFLRC